MGRSLLPMTTQLWISTAQNLAMDASDPDWEHAGELDEARETDLWRIVQGELGYRAASRRRSVSFYADLDPESATYQDIQSRHPDVARGLGIADSSVRFWLQLRWAGPPPRTFLVSQQARLAALERRVPEPHPGRIKRLIPVGLKLHADDHGFFRRPDHDLAE